MSKSEKHFKTVNAFDLEYFVNQQAYEILNDDTGYVYNAILIDNRDDRLTFLSDKTDRPEDDSHKMVASSIPFFLGVSCYTIKITIDQYIDHYTITKLVPEGKHQEKKVESESCKTDTMCGVVGRIIDFDSGKQSTIGNVDESLVYNNIMLCTVSQDGGINAWEGDSDYIEDGSNGQVMVYIPRFYYRVSALVSNRNELHRGEWSISHKQLDGYKLHPMFQGEDPDDVKDYILVGVFDASECKQKGVHTLESVDGVYPVTDLTIADAMEMASNLGDGWKLTDITVISGLQLLMLIERGPDLQKAVGIGNTDGYPGPITGNDSRGVEYRGIRNFWGNVWTFVPDMILDHDNTLILKGKNTGITIPDMNGWLKYFMYNKEYDWLFLPAVVCANEDDSVVGDYISIDTRNNGSITIALLGGRWANGSSCGAFYWYLNGSVGYRARIISAPEYVIYLRNSSQPIHLG